jgi:hypothetical protein
MPNRSRAKWYYTTVRKDYAGNYDFYYYDEYDTVEEATDARDNQIGYGSEDDWVVLKVTTTYEEL